MFDYSITLYYENRKIRRIDDKNRELRQHF